MSFRRPLAWAAWQHRDAREGFEVVFVHCDRDGYRLQGSTAAVENGEAWIVDYLIALSAGWATRSAMVSRSADRVSIRSSSVITHSCWFFARGTTDSSGEIACALRLSGSQEGLPVVVLRVTT